MGSTVDHPSHYNAHPSGVETIVVKQWLSSNLGDALKYVMRAGKKDGQDPLGDLDKAIRYIDFERERYENDPLKTLRLESFFVGRAPQMRVAREALWKIAEAEPSASARGFYETLYHGWGFSGIHDLRHYVSLYRNDIERELSKPKTRREWLDSLVTGDEVAVRCMAVCESGRALRLDRLAAVHPNRPLAKFVLTRELLTFDRDGFRENPREVLVEPTQERRDAIRRVEIAKRLSGLRKEELLAFANSMEE